MTATPGDFERSLRVWAPDGTTFEVRAMVNPNVHKPEQLDDLPLLLQYEVRGPDGQDHLWLAAWHGELLPNPADEDIPRSWTVKAQHAIRGWLQLKDELGPD